MEKNTFILLALLSEQTQVDDLIRGYHGDIFMSFYDQ